MGLMGFVNLAHGVFAMAGGYVMTTLMKPYGVPFPLAVAGAALGGGGGRASRSSACSTAGSTAATSSTRCC